MYRVLAAIFCVLYFAGNSALAQIPGTNGLFSCETDENGEKVVVTYKQANEFVPPTKKKIKRQTALNFMVSKVRPTQHKVITQSLRLSRQLKASVQGSSAQESAVGILSTHDQAVFNNVMSDALKTGHLTGNAPSVNSSVADILAAFDQIFANKRDVEINYRKAVRELQKCKGCETKASRSDSSGLRKGKKKSKRKCGCFTKTVAATLEYYYGNNPSKPNNCQAFGLAKWSAAETKNAKSVEVFYTWNYQGGDLRSKFATPPYDDALPYYDQILYAGEGSHQLVIVKGSASHGNPEKVVDCSEMSAKQQAAVIAPYYVEAEICPLG